MSANVRKHCKKYGHDEQFIKPIEVSQINFTSFDENIEEDED